MFRAVKEGEPGWTEPSKSVKLTRHIRYALGLNPFIGGTPIEPEMSVTTFILYQPKLHEKFMKDLMEYYGEK